MGNSIICFRRVSVMLAGFLLLFSVHDVWGGPPTNELKSAIDKVVKILDDPSLKGNGRVKERRMAIRQVANEIFDFPEMAKRALARHWQGRTGQEQEEFVRLFADLLEHTYIGKIERHGGPEQIRYGREQSDGDFAAVPTTILTKQGQEVSVNYQMVRRADGWVVYDVAVEGVSLVSNYRGQFNKIIQTSSYEELVKQLKVKQKEFAEQDGRG